MGQPIRVYSRHETYTYLGHKFNIAGEWGEQIQELSCDYKNRIDLIDSSPLPVVMKLEAIREVALAKIQHLFANVHIPQNVLQDMNNKTVEAVRRWLGLNTHSTRDVLFLSHKEGGLGVPNVEWTYTTTRLTHLIRMLNNNDAAVRELARASLLLDLRRRKVPLATAGQENFLGFRKKGNGKLDTQAAGYGVRSDWPDLNDLCNRAAVRLKWEKVNSHTAPDASDAVVTDPSVNVDATVYHNGTQQTLHNTTARKSLLNIKQAETKQHWTGLRLQGKLACLDFADHSVSHSMYRNAAVGEDILCFTVKARLQVLPTKYNLALWYPNTHHPHCIMHSNPNQHLESIAHIVNGCNKYKGLYTARHDRIVDLISSTVKGVFPPNVSMYKHSRIMPDWFNSSDDVFCNIPNTPDVVFLDKVKREVVVLEVACVYDLYMDIAFLDKLTKYQPIVAKMRDLGYTCKMVVLIFGSLGHVHKLSVSGLRLAGLSKRQSKQLAKFCSVSAAIGSLAVWRRRCFLYP